MKKHSRFEWGNEHDEMFETKKNTVSDVVQNHYLEVKKRDKSDVMRLQRSWELPQNDYNAKNGNPSSLLSGFWMKQSSIIASIF